jgi:hypothetical protein
VTFAGGSSNILTSETDMCCDILQTDISNGVVQNCPKAENFSVYSWQKVQEENEVRVRAEIITQLF